MSATNCLSASCSLGFMQILRYKIERTETLDEMLKDIVRAIVGSSELPQHPAAAPECQAMWAACHWDGISDFDRVKATLIVASWQQASPVDE